MSTKPIPPMSSAFPSSYNRWLEEPSPQKLSESMTLFFLKAKETLWGVTHTEASFQRSLKCLRTPESAHVAWEAVNRAPAKTQESVTEALENQLVLRALHCATEVTKELPQNPNAYPIPLSEKTLPKLERTQEAFLMAFKDNCFPCHVATGKKMCTAETFSQNVFTVPKESRHLLPQSAQDQLDGTPFFWRYVAGQYYPLSMEEFQKVATERCSN